MNKQTFNDYVENECKNFSDRVFKRIESEKLHPCSSHILFGILFAGMENMESEEFIKDSKRVLDIAYEESITLRKEAGNFLKKNDVSK